jgi:membrane protease subunit (stomatin/prohibitin family)
LEIANIPVLSFAHFFSPLKNVFAQMVGKEFFNVTGNRTAIRSHFALRLEPQLNQAGGSNQSAKPRNLS